jgi:hypothetical protein
MTETVAGFFGGGAGGYAKFPTIGTKVKGTITAVHPPEQQTDYTTKQPIAGKYQVRIELATDERDPEIDGDDGSRTLSVKGWMQGAVGEAIRKADVKEPQVGAMLEVVRIEDAPPTRPGMQGAYRFAATYTPSGQFFAGADEAQAGNGQPAAAPANAPIPDAPPAGIDAQAWAAMPVESKQAIANVTAAMK